MYINPIFIRNVQVLADCRNILNYSSAQIPRAGSKERANAHNLRARGAAIERARAGRK